MTETYATQRISPVSRSPFLSLLGNPIVELMIRENRITNCLQNPFDTGLREESKTIGFGGISLGLCEDVSIVENYILQNGTSYTNPVCGIFILFGEQVDINHNKIIDNGAIVAGRNVDLESGLRGGIIGQFASFGLLNLILDQLHVRTNR